MKSKVRTIAIIIISILLLILIAVIIYNVVYLPTTKEDIQQTNEDNSDDNISVKHIFLQDSCRAASVFHTIIQKIYALKLRKLQLGSGRFSDDWIRNLLQRRFHEKEKDHSSCCRFGCGCAGFQA